MNCFFAFSIKPPGDAACPWGDPGSTSGSTHESGITRAAAFALWSSAVASVATVAPTPPTTLKSLISVF